MFELKNFIKKQPPHLLIHIGGTEEKYGNNKKSPMRVRPYINVNIKF